MSKSSRALLLVSTSNFNIPCTVHYLQAFADIVNLHVELANAEEEHGRTCPYSEESGIRWAEVERLHTALVTAVADRLPFGSKSVIWLADVVFTLRRTLWARTDVELYEPIIPSAERYNLWCRNAIRRGKYPENFLPVICLGDNATVTD